MKVALVDVDGVVTDFTDHLLQCVAPFGERDVPLTLADITDWNIFSFLNEDEKWAAFSMLDEQEFWRSQPVLPGAVEGIAALRTKYHVVFATSPWVSCRKWGWLRARWLLQHFNAPPEDVVVVARKELLRGDLFIDDKPEHAVAWAATNPCGRVWLFDAPYNQECESVARIFGWDHVQEKLSQQNLTRRVAETLNTSK